MMIKTLSLALLFSCSFFVSSAQHHIIDYTGVWSGTTAKKNVLNLDIVIEKQPDGDAVFTLSNDQEILSKTFQFDQQIELILGDELTFSGRVNEQQSEISGFIQLSKDFYPAKLHKKGDHFAGNWNLSVIHYLQPQSLRLSIKEGGGADDEYQAYPILGTLWCDNFKQENNTISFTDYKTGLEFAGQLQPGEIELDISLAGHFITNVSYKKADSDKDSNTTSAPENILIQDGWEYAKKQLRLPQMEAGIRTDSLVGIESVLVAKKGKIAYETYFAGFTANTPHDMRSASKSVSSAIIGIAIDDKIIMDVEQEVYPHLPAQYQYTKDDQKAKIRLKDLLTMSSGIKVSEDQYQSSDNWLKTVLESPLKNQAGTHTAYKSADPYLTGVYLSERLEIPLEFYMEEHFFTPLGITNYIMNADDTKVTPYFGGGLHLTPRDMLKFGQLYLNKGTWNGNRILSKAWVKASFQKHTQLQNVSDKNEYGYLWWHDTYTVNKKSISTIEARGAGGQFIFVIPALESVVVITAGNYRNRKGNQSREIFEAYILPKLLK